MTKTETRQSLPFATVRPVRGLTGATEFFWTVVRDGRLLASGIADTEDAAERAAETAYGDAL